MVMCGSSRPMSAASGRSRTIGGSLSGTLNLVQRYQRIGGTLALGGKTQPLLGAWIDGEKLGFSFIDSDEQAAKRPDERCRIKHDRHAVRPPEDPTHRQQALSGRRQAVDSPTPAVPPAPRPLLRPADAIAIIVGIVVGAGIFKTPSMVAGVTGDVGWLVVAWGLGAIVSLAGALCYAELATAYPHAGGDYYFLTRAFGRHTSFLYAWARSTVINSGSIALLAFVFGDYMSTVLSLGPASGALWAAGIVIALTVLNIAGLRASAGTQNLLTVIEVLRSAGRCRRRLPGPAGRRSCARGVHDDSGARHVRPGDGLRAADLRWLERGRVYLGRARRWPACDRVGPGYEPRDHCRGLPAREPRAPVRARVAGAHRKQGRGSGGHGAHVRTGGRAPRWVCSSPSPRSPRSTRR